MHRLKNHVPDRLRASRNAKNNVFIAKKATPTSKFIEIFIILTDFAQNDQNELKISQYEEYFEVGVAFFAMKTLFLTFLDARNRSGT